MHSATKRRESSTTSDQNSRVPKRPKAAGGNGRPRYAHAWHEIEDLYLKILKAYYGQENRRRAMQYIPRLEELLRMEASDHVAILGEECWALVCELRGDLAEAIAFRRNQIRQIGKLWKTLPGTPDIARNAILEMYGPADLADRYDLLAGLYHDAGQLKKAIKTLWQSRELCELHGIKFDGKDLLRDYLAEFRAKAGSKKAPARKAS
jgi:tetratricopeptide (TPR) repeat protein